MTLVQIFWVRYYTADRTINKCVYGFHGKEDTFSAQLALIFFYLSQNIAYRELQVGYLR